MQRNPKLFEYVNCLIYKKYLGFIYNIDYQISRNIYDANIETRPVKSNGLWCAVILPMVIIINTFLYNVSQIYYLVAYIALGLMFYSLLFIVFLSVSCLVLTEPAYGGCIASSLISTLLLYTFLGKGLIFSLLFSLISVYSFSTLLRLSLTKCPKTFTIGEAILVVQSIVLYGAMTAAKLVKVPGETDEEMDFVSAVVITVSSTVAIIVTSLSLMTEKRKELQCLGYVVGSAILYTLFVLHWLLGINCLFKIFNFIFMNQRRIQLVTCWLCMVLIAVLVLLVRTQLNVKATTVTRKSFHLLASVVFLTGIIYDQYLMMLAAGLGFGFLVLLEALRKTEIEPFSSALQAAFIIYSDEKDCGSFALTPFYLYCGLACPLLLAPTNCCCFKLELLSGVLAIGVGDTAASWFGSKFGFFKWTGTNKTVEGTAFNIITQISTVYALQLFEVINDNNALIRTAFAATVSGITEATTEQVDNLVLPIVMLLAFQITWPLS